MKTSESSLDANAVQPGWVEAKILNRFVALVGETEGALRITMPSGFQQTLGRGAVKAELQIHRLRAFLRLFTGGLNGWAKAYIEGDWDCDDIPGLIIWALQRESEVESLASGGRLAAIADRLYHLSRDNTKKGSKENIQAHYDLGNDFYQLWLDSSMTYSSAVFASPEQSLFDAQQHKYKTILDSLELPDEPQNVLEIGCGWGGFAELLAQQTEHNLKGITLSEEQLAFAKQRLENSADRVVFSLTDYRDVQEQVDAIVSIEMLEAVGEKHWDTYFAKINQVLKPGGRAVIQVITIDDQRFEGYSQRADFIQKYIFPGGMLPSPERLRDKFQKHNLTLVKESYHGKDYAETLRQWRDKFESAWPEIAPQGFDESFRRTWRYYLTYCEGGFDFGSIDLGIYVLEKPAVD